MKYTTMIVQMIEVTSGIVDWGRLRCGGTARILLDFVMRGLDFKQKNAGGHPKSPRLSKGGVMQSQTHNQIMTFKC